MEELALRNDAKVALVNEQAALAEKLAAELTVANEDSMAIATSILGRVASGKKAAEERRKELVAPLNEQVKTINDFFRSLVAPFERADATLRDKVLTYRRELERQRREEEERLRKLAEKEQAKLEKKAEKKGLEPPPPMPIPVVAAPVRTVSADFGKATIRQVWDFEITDPSQLPREYLVPDMAKLRAVVKAGVREIPGCRIYQTEQLAVSGR